MLRHTSFFFLLALLPLAAQAHEPGRTDGSDNSWFTFAWPLGEGALKPRGASTRGAPVVLDTAPGEAWRRMREPGLSTLERDRRAILAMAGPYRVSFDFLEVLRFDPALKPDAPYQSWGTEYVFVSEDRGDFIALQHVLVMHVQMEDGSTSKPMVVRHWRQHTSVLPYAFCLGHRAWRRLIASYGIGCPAPATRPTCPKQSASIVIRSTQAMMANAPR